MEIDQLKYDSIKSLDVMEMEELLKQAPWFSYLRQILLEKIYHMDREAFSGLLAGGAVFLSSRTTLYERINSPDAEQDTVGSFPDSENSTSVQPNQQPLVIEEVPRPRVIVAGGDFFSKEDLKTISPEDDMELKLRKSPFYRSAQPEEEQNQPLQRQKGRSTLLTEDGKVNFDDLAFCTETLGHIYAQQGFYEKAIDVFSKLILLYPQKSAYFAALVNDLKKNLD